MAFVRPRGRVELYCIVPMQQRLKHFQQKWEPVLRSEIRKNK
ncbi:hypothetical protein CES85_0954 [Ochrobactrum quorumnocens]|uniref:Uncharacterized protein n=1 Tax=Ochrobactrum quorumnocens TaxID=271865 RepID=A0A248UFL9_9HYPH|nr:hypothetical protein CES85_0954 [[Ochrobactrum] quorumnocens]